MTKPNVQMVVIEFEAQVSHRLGVAEFLLNAAKILDVTPVSLGMDFFPSPDNECRIGFTAEVKFQESFCLIDSWPERCYALVVAVSCKPFSTEGLVALIRKSWDTKNIDVKDVFSRGRRGA